MSTTQHTPGPWEIHRDGEAAFVYASGSYMSVLETEEGPKPYRHGLIALPYSTQCQGGIQAGSQLANAQLIAAAPELLQHLCILAAEDSQCATDWIEKKKAARAAIAKAKGEL